MAKVTALIADTDDINIGQELSLTAILDEINEDDKVIYFIAPDFDLKFRSENHNCCDENESIECCDQTNLSMIGNCICKQADNILVISKIRLEGTDKGIIKIGAFTCSSPKSIELVTINIS